jgi:cytochrome c biogenesis protein
MNRARRIVLRGWRRLTSMRTALVLLFLLAVAAVPGSLLPQRPLNPTKVQTYIDSHGSWGEVLNALGMFDVFGSVWFAAIYLLLFVSLAGCLVPRIRVHARAVARKPLPAPRNLDRLPESGSFETGGDAAEYAVAARSTLGRRWRVEQREEKSGAITLSAEKGYSRETGNLIFHIALLVSLVLVAVGRLYSYEGQKIVVQGQGFCNTINNYDTWKPGRFAAEGKVSPAPFCIEKVTNFVAKYTSQDEPTEFRADLTYRPTLDSPVEHAALTVNHPLRIGGDRVYLINHGFAPQLTITMPDGSVVHDTQPFIASDGSTLLSEGVFKEQGRPGAKQDIGVRGLFAPTPSFDGSVVTSVSPQVRHPVLGIFVFKGDLDYRGLPQSVFSLDTSKMKKIGAANLRVGQTTKFSGGVRVRFDGWLPWISIQVSHDPAQGWLLWSAAAMVVGLFGSLGVRRRRVWLRLTPSSDAASRSLTVVSVGGLARSDSGNFTTEFAALFDRLRAAGRPAQEQLVPVGRE